MSQPSPAEGGAAQGPNTIPEVLQPAFAQTLVEQLIETRAPLSTPELELAERYFKAGAAAGAAAVRELATNPAGGVAGASAAAKRAARPDVADEIFAQPATNAEPAAPADDPAPATGETQQETLRGLISRHPTTAEVNTLVRPAAGFGVRAARWGAPNRYANEGAWAIYEAHNATLPAGASTAVLEAQAERNSLSPHEVHAFTDAGDQYARQMPADTAGERGVVVDYHISNAVNPITVTIRRVLPESAAQVIDTHLERGETEMVRTLTQEFLDGELQSPEYADPDKLTGADLAEYKALLAAADSLQGLYAQSDGQKKPRVVRLSNVAGIAGGVPQKNPVIDGARQYSRVETPIGERAGKK